MRARVPLILIILGLVMAFTAAPVSAGGGSLAIANADGGIGKGFDSLFGGPWTEGVSGCPSGAYFDTDRYRSALEFPLTDLPPEATVLGATLHSPRVHTVHLHSARDVRLRGRWLDHGAGHPGHTWVNPLHTDYKRCTCGLRRDEPGNSRHDQRRLGGILDPTRSGVGHDV